MFARLTRGLCLTLISYFLLATAWGWQWAYNCGSFYFIISMEVTMWYLVFILPVSVAVCWGGAVRGKIRFWIFGALLSAGICFTGYHVTMNQPSWDDRPGQSGTNCAAP
jgi:hypothetical protein